MNRFLVHSPGYDLSLPGLDWLHPFDGRKFGRAWDRVVRETGGACESARLVPDAGIAEADLLRVHGASYLRSLADPAVVAAALELRALAWLPASVVERRILAPMRLATAGTALAVDRALTDSAIAMNLGGGFHHAFADHGEGFCLYADVAVALAAARARGLLAAGDAVAIVDLDAHRGNGVWSLLGDDPDVRVLDVYNFQAYPGLLDGSVDELPFQVPVKSGTGDVDYLDTVSETLPVFLDEAGPRPRLAVYNAGTDILAGDPVGRLGVSAAGVAARDGMVLDALVERGIPTVILTSGGYTKRSHELVAKLALRVFGHGA